MGTWREARDRREHTRGAVPLTSEKLVGRVGFFHYSTGRILIPGAANPPPAPDVHHEMMELLFSSPAKDEAAMAGKRLQSLSLNK